MQASDIPAKLPVPFAAQAGAGYIRPIPAASQIGIVDGAASFPDGFVPLNATPVGAGGKPPDIKDMNGILNAISAWARWTSAGGTTRFDGAFAGAVDGYPLGAVLASANDGGRLWISVADNNGTDPDGPSSANWVSVGPGKATPAEAAARTDDTKYVTPAGLAGALAGSLVVGHQYGVNGYRLYDDGYAEIWGTFAKSQFGPGSYRMTFHTPFAATCFNVGATPLIPNASTGNNTLIEIVDGSIDRFGCTIQVNTPNSGGAYHAGVSYSAKGN